MRIQRRYVSTEILGISWELHSEVSLLYQQAPPRYAQGSPPAYGPRPFGSGENIERDSSHPTLALTIMARARRNFDVLSPSEKVECAKDVTRNFRLESVRVTFDLPPHAQVAGLHRDFLLGWCRQIEGLGGGPLSREPLVLMWMMKQYDKEAAVQWRMAFDEAHSHARPGRRIEYIIQALSKAYVNPIVAATIREALDNFQWLPKANVQVVRATFAALQNEYDSAVEDT